MDAQNKNVPFLGLFNDSFPPILDGVTLAVQNYAHWLSELNYSPLVVTPWNPEKIQTPYPVMRFFSLPIWNRHPYRYGYPKLDPFIWGKLKKTPFSLVHSHCPFSSGRLGVYVKKYQKVPLIATFHSKYRTDLEHSFRHTPWMVDIIMKRILNFFNACDQVWIPQAEVEETVREYGYKGELTVVENGNDFADLSDSKVHEEYVRARQKFGIAPETLSMLFVGQHILEKGIQVIVEALSLLPPEIDFRMDFIGSGYAAKETEELAWKLRLKEKVHFHGVIKDRKLLKEHYAASDIFLFPSFYDNAPLVVREAAALGTPTILLKGSTAAEVIKDGENGFLAERTPESYAEIIAKMYSERNRLSTAGINARHTIVRSWRDVVEEVADRYTHILNNHRKV